MLVADIVDEFILELDIMTQYGFVVKKILNIDKVEIVFYVPDWKERKVRIVFIEGIEILPKCECKSFWTWSFSFSLGGTNKNYQMSSVRSSL